METTTFISIKTFINVCSRSSIANARVQHCVKSPPAQSFFTISSFVFSRRKKFTQVCSNLRVSINDDSINPNEAVYSPYIII